MTAILTPSRATGWIHLSIEIVPGPGEWKMLTAVAERYGMRLSNPSNDGDTYFLDGQLDLDELRSLQRRWAKSVRMCDIAEQINDELERLGMKQ